MGSTEPLCRKWSRFFLQHKVLSPSRSFSSSFFFFPFLSPLRGITATPQASVSAANMLVFSLFVFFPFFVRALSYLLKVAFFSFSLFSFFFFLIVRCCSELSHFCHVFHWDITQIVVGVEKRVLWAHAANEQKKKKEKKRKEKRGERGGGGGGRRRKACEKVTCRCLDRLSFTFKCLTITTKTALM